MTQYVYRFGGGVSDGKAGDKALLGGKGANLAEMASIGLPVPPGFTISTEMCARYYDEGQKFPDSLREEVARGIAHIERVTGKVFGDVTNPLLVSVRSGARASMPGMMDTVLNLGLNDETVRGLAAASGDARFAWDSYRRFVQMYANVVLDLGHDPFEEALEIAKEDKGVHLDTELEANDWERVTARFKELVEQGWGHPFPQDAHEQLWGAVGAVFGSWQSDRARTYRRLHHIPGDWGTAVNVQAMVFGNMGETSATGVAFTRDPATGERAYYGEYLINAQGEDVVAGIRTPQYLTRAARERAGAKAPSMEERLPEIFVELTKNFDLLEAHYREMQDIEFTVERGKLWMLQTRTGKRTAKASLRIAVDMAQEGLISTDEAVLRIDPAQLDQLLHPTLDPKAERNVIAKGLPASPGAACGKAVFDADTAQAWAERKEKVILVRVETSPEDIHGMHAAEGILTARGGMTSHAAVVARGMGRPCVSGAGTISIDYKNRLMRVGDQEYREGEIITLDGTTGEVMLGEVATVQPELVGDFGTLMEWADARRRLRVRANAETPTDCRAAREFGAEGIGLCRTEHMFFDSERIANVRQMILAGDEAGRRSALDKLLPAQRGDFEQIFRIMAGLPVTIRLLDPPLHEFLPNSEEEFAEVARGAGVDVEVLRRRASELHEVNPMLGHRGCRLGITYPEIYEMQARAIFEASVAVARDGEAPIPEIMVPLVATRTELRIIRELIDRVAAQVFEEQGLTLDYLVGTMIELPRAALAAAGIAEEAQFFSFGTNDLTQTALGVSRDDAGRFLSIYVEKGIFDRDPFVSLDVEGVGELIAIAAERGRGAKDSLKLGICGEHGGDPASIAFCERTGLDYVSASPYRVPIARLAAAQAALRSTG
ncbi:MAG TPA: pyruvate, phosphate dikinase [Allosphingosinicella sp.]|nr:pyruvate, phosphate dikinase [Allosphingosinicella sp.]